MREAGDVLVSDPVTNSPDKKYHPMAFQYLRLREIGMNPKTHVRLTREIGSWCAYLDGQNVEPPHATYQHVSAYMQQLTSSAGTRSNVVYSLRKFYTWMMKQKACEKNPWDEVDPPKRAKKLMRVLSPQEIDLLTAGITTNKTRYQWRDLRDRAFFMMLRDTGCRISEIRMLDMNDLRLATTESTLGEATVMGKGSKERIVFFGWDTSEAVRKYIDEGRCNKTKRIGGALWLSGRGENRWSDVAARRVIYRLEKQTHIERHVHPHLLRHSFATTMLRRGCNIYALSKMLGHANLSSTEVYLHVVSEDLKQEYLKAMDAARTAKRTKNGRREQQE